MTSPREESDKLMAFPSSSLLPHAFVFNKRSLPPRSTNQTLFVSRRLSGAPLHVIDMRIKLPKQEHKVLET